MVGKTIPLSVRVAEEDSDFLAGLVIPGATTPSDKIRALIRDARMRHAGERSYAEGLTFQEEQLSPLIRQLRGSERELGMHSELLVQFMNWLPEATAYLHAELSEQGMDDDRKAALLALERGIAERALSLMEACLRLAVTPKEPCYDTSCVREKVSPILELSTLVESSIIQK